jgi:hypothetical protein
MTVHHGTTRGPGEGPETLPEHTPSTLKFFGQFVLVVMVIVVVLVAGFTIVVWSLRGGIEYHASDWTVRNARRAADAKARPAVDHVAADLAPTLGEPDRRAMIDNCYRSTQIFDNRLTCVRSMYLYYPLTTALPDAATVAGAIPTTRWPTAWVGGCSADQGTTRACRGTSETLLIVQVNSVNASAYNRIPRGASTEDLVEQDGFPELRSVVESGPSVIVAYTTTYFSG